VDSGLTTAVPCRFNAARKKCNPGDHSVLKAFSSVFSADSVVNNDAHQVEKVRGAGGSSGCKRKKWNLWAPAGVSGCCNGPRTTGSGLPDKVDNGSRGYYIPGQYARKRKDDIIMAKNVVEINDSSFETEVIQNEKPVLVDFWAPWCGPCKAIGPLIEDLAGSFGDKVKFAKCNVDDNPATPGKYGIQSIPTLMIFKNGKMLYSQPGVVPAPQLTEIVKRFVN